MTDRGSCEANHAIHACAEVKTRKAESLPPNRPVSVRASVRRIDPKPHMPVEAGMRPVDHPLHMPMPNRVVVDGVDVSSKVIVIADRVLPETSPRDAALPVIARAAATAARHAESISRTTP